MIEPTKVKVESKKLEDQNLRFRTFLKNHADSEELDAHFLALHNELFGAYDCCKCGNCCKSYDTVLEEDDLTAISKFLGKTEKDFINEYLTETDEGYKIKETPCCFLDADGKCKIQECKPSVCKGFPYTDQPDRLSSMLGILQFSEECPVVFEMLERLKKVYRFRSRR